MYAYELSDLSCNDADGFKIAVINMKRRFYNCLFVFLKTYIDHKFFGSNSSEQLK